jgi:hypothetical protein
MMLSIPFICVLPWLSPERSITQLKCFGLLRYPDADNRRLR